ncbi:glycosyltransferase [Vibrio breoganii]
MKILINGSNLKVGGGLQVCLSVLDELNTLSNDSNSYLVVMSTKLSNLINIEKFDDRFDFVTLEDSKLKLNKALDKLVDSHLCNVVFTVFGPAYWRPKVPHVLGFANGWMINPNSLAESNLSLLSKLKLRVKNKFRLWMLARDADIYITETYTAKKKLSRYSSIDCDNIFVVGNTVHPLFYDDSKWGDIELPVKKANDFVFCIIAHNYPHKNLKAILSVLEDSSLNHVNFIVTIDEDSFKQLFSGYTNRVINLGRVEIEKCPSIYAHSDGLFFPSLLETFTAAYPEAMFMRCPILTSDLDFAHDICGDAALYFDPTDSMSITSAVRKFIENKKLRLSIVENGSKRFLNLESSFTRTVKYLELCNRANKTK